MIAQGMGDDVTSVLGHADTAITRTIYAHEFEKVERDKPTREGMEKVFGGRSVAATDER
jgi:hypothetical protein